MTTNPSEDFRQPEKVLDFPTPTPDNKQQHYIAPLTADKYRRTGECNDPRLKGILKRYYAGEEVLPVKRAERLVTALIEGSETVEKAVFLLKDKIEDLEIHLVLSENKTIEMVTIVENEIEYGQKNLDRGIDQVLNITRKHGQTSVSQLNYQQKDDYQQSQELVKDITYFQRFFREKAHLSVAAFEQSPHPQAYFRRINNYLNYLPGTCRELVNLTRQSIFDKVPGTQSDDLTL